MTDMIHILVVDDEPEIRAILRHGLEEEGFAVAEAGETDALFAAIEKQPVDLITLDLNLGRKDGLELAREIRARHNVPIIMITGRGDPVDRVKGLEQGADDYIVKPFLMREVIIRVRSVLARYGEGSPIGVPPTPGNRYAFDNCILDAKRRELRQRSGDIIGLTETEFRLLELFLRNPARVMSRDEIWQMLRGHDWSPLDRAIDGHVARLIRKIERDGDDEPRLIKSVRGVGYVFTADVLLV